MSGGRESREVEIECKVVGSTENALRIDYGGKEPVWIPRSQITDYSPDTDDDSAIESIFLPEWLATEKGLL